MTACFSFFWCTVLLAMGQNRKANLEQFFTSTFWIHFRSSPDPPSLPADSPPLSPETDLVPVQTARGCASVLSGGICLRYTQGCCFSAWCIVYFEHSFSPINVWSSYYSAPLCLNESLEAISSKSNFACVLCWKIYFELRHFSVNCP